jgi:hypothetical protein
MVPTAVVLQRRLATLLAEDRPVAERFRLWQHYHEFYRVFALAGEELLHRVEFPNVVVPFLPNSKIGTPSLRHVNAPFSTSEIG